MNGVDSNGLPLIEDLMGHVSALKRRLNWLQERINRPGQRENSAHYDREEAAALKAAVRALMHHRAGLEDEDMASLALADVLAQIQAATVHDHIESTHNLENAIERAKCVLERIGE